MKEHLRGLVGSIGAAVILISLGTRKAAAQSDSMTFVQESGVNAVDAQPEPPYYKGAHPDFLSGANQGVPAPLPQPDAEPAAVSADPGIKNDISIAPDPSDPTGNSGTASDAYGHSKKYRCAQGYKVYAILSSDSLNVGCEPLPRRMGGPANAGSHIEGVIGAPGWINSNGSGGGWGDSSGYSGGWSADTSKTSGAWSDSNGHRGTWRCKPGEEPLFAGDATHPGAYHCAKSGRDVSVPNSVVGNSANSAAPVDAKEAQAGSSTGLHSGESTNQYYDRQIARAKSRGDAALVRELEKAKKKFGSDDSAFPDYSSRNAAAVPAAASDSGAVPAAQEVARVGGSAGGKNGARSSPAGCVSGARIYNQERSPSLKDSVCVDNCPSGYVRLPWGVNAKATCISRVEPAKDQGLPKGAVLPQGAAVLQYDPGDKLIGYRSVARCPKGQAPAYYAYLHNYICQKGGGTSGTHNSGSHKTLQPIDSSGAPAGRAASSNVGSEIGSRCLSGLYRKTHAAECAGR